MQFSEVRPDGVGLAKFGSSTGIPPTASEKAGSTAGGGTQQQIRDPGRTMTSFGTQDNAVTFTARNMRKPWERAQRNCLPACLLAYVIRTKEKKKSLELKILREEIRLGDIVFLLAKQPQMHDKLAELGCIYTKLPKHHTTTFFRIPFLVAPSSAHQTFHSPSRFVLYPFIAEAREGSRPPS